MKKYLPKTVAPTITPEAVFFDRRSFVARALALGAGGAALFCGGPPDQLASASTSEDKGEHPALAVPFERPAVFPAQRNDHYPLPAAVRGVATPRLAAATHNNYYEFLAGRGGPVYRHTQDFKVTPWKIEIGGACNNPMTLDLDALFAFPHEERLYHFRCVERWAMNIPWSGFPLAALIRKADPKSKAKYVRFTSVKRPKEMPGMAETGYYNWPYVEALRLDEAMNELALCVTGVYGKPLPIQHGAPIRIIVPWKYGYKNPKAIVKIEFLEERPKTFWMVQAHEYGFISNVNPNIPHPRWSQERSYWLHLEDQWFPTALFNGYENYVGKLYPDEPRTPQRPLQAGQVAR